MATGNPSSATMASSSATPELPPNSSENAVARTPSAATTAASTSHWSCRRCSGPLRRNRTTNDATAASSPTNSSSHPATPSYSGWPSDTVSPVGFWTHSMCSGGLTALPTTTRITPAAVTHTAGRHRRDASRPSGNTSSTRAMAASKTASAQLVAHHTQSRAGRAGSTQV
jgi:hypothetical protein